MDCKAHALRLIGHLVTALAAMLLFIPLADAGRRNSQPDPDGWYYNVLRAGEATPSAANGSRCRANRAYQQAVATGELSAVIAALHGSVEDAPFPKC